MTAVGILLLIGLSLYASGAAVALVLSRAMAPRVLVAVGVLGSMALAAAGGRALLVDGTFHASLWTVSTIGTLTVAVDRLSGFFLVVTSIVSLPASVFAANFIRVVPAHADRNGDEAESAGSLSKTGMSDPRRFVGLYLALLASIATVIVANDAFLFLISWESMSVLIYLLISRRGERPSYLMLAIGEAGTLAVAISLLLSAGGGALDFASLRSSAGSLSAGLTWSVFLLSFFGFGAKAGLVPVNAWMTRTYAAAPAAFAPLMAGATLNMGLYGIVRVNADILPVHAVSAGLIVLAVGTITALVGILYAVIEDDLKTVLAHSSIENAGIITVGLGAAFIFMSTGHRVPAAIALVAALYHLLNHSVFKTLLFMGSAAIEERAGTRSLDRLGGLLKRMPWTGLFFLVGTLAISAMPPFNGFASEWLTLQSLLRSVELASVGVRIAFVVAGAGLALTAGLAVTCFVRAFSMGFLGIPRSDAVKRVREIGKTTLAAMAFLAFASLVLGVLPTYVIPAVDRVVAPVVGASATEALVPAFFVADVQDSGLPSGFASEFHDLGADIGRGALPGRGLALIHRGGTDNPVVFAMSTPYMFVTLLLLLGLATGGTWLFAKRRRRVDYRPRWDGGVRSFTPEMTYTATGFAQPVRVLFRSILRPIGGDRLETAFGRFRMSITRERMEIHPVDRVVVRPLARAFERISSLLAYMHGGRVNSYALYVLVTLILFLVLASTVR